MTLPSRRTSSSDDGRSARSDPESAPVSGQKEFFTRFFKADFSHFRIEWQIAVVERVETCFRAREHRRCNRTLESLSCHPSRLARHAILTSITAVDHAPLRSMPQTSHPTVRHTKKFAAGARSARAQRRDLPAGTVIDLRSGSIWVCEPRAVPTEEM